MRRIIAPLFALLFIVAAAGTAEAQIRGRVVLDRGGIRFGEVVLGEVYEYPRGSTRAPGPIPAPPYATKVKEEQKKGKYEYKWEADGCKYKYEVKNGKVEEKFDCKRGREYAYRRW